MASKTMSKSLSTYLRAVADPASLIDQHRVAALREQVGAASDPLERIRLRKELRDAQQPEVDHQPFIDNAWDWAQENGVEAEDFIAEGVPADVLRSAGFRVQAGTRSRNGRRASSGTRSRATTADIVNAMPKGPFTIRDLQGATGASLATVRSAVRSQLDLGTVTEVGLDARFSGPGRRPTQYQRA